MNYVRLSEADIRGNIGKRIYLTFMCREVEMRTQKDGVSQYMNMTIQDGAVEESCVKIFGIKDYHREMVKPGGIYAAAVDVQRYENAKNGYSLCIYNISMISEADTGYLNWSDGIANAKEVITKEVNLISDEIYAKVVKSVLNRCWDRFAIYPAAKSVHHHQMGGLCVHTAEVFTIACNIANVLKNMGRGENINIELVKAAAILHDIGKVEELSVDEKSGRVEYSKNAALESHVVTTAVMIDTEARCLGLYDDTNNIVKVRLLKHCILAHHGKKEYGSPIEPSTIEAYIVSKADGISADSFRFDKNISELERGESSCIWTGGNMEIYYRA